MERKQDELPVLIVGAGNCGLAIAHGLKNANIAYKIFEQDLAAKSRNARDWAMGIHWSYPAFVSLIGPEKWARIIETQTDPNEPTKELDHFPLINGQTGEIIRSVPIRSFYRVLRSRFRAFLAEDIDVAWGKKLVDISYNDDASGSGTSNRGSVTAHFADGTSATGRLLLGADSANSRVRTLLVGPERARLHRLSLAATFINCRFTREQALFLRRTHPVVSMIIHPNGTVGLLAALDMADAARPETWVFTMYISWRTTTAEQDAEAAAAMGPRERLAQAKEKARAFADPLRSAYAWLPDDLDTVYYTPNGNWDPSLLPEHAWDNRGGRVTLVGDAAHPMTYHRGQGLNHALDDAGHLVRLLAEQGDKPLSAVVDAYEAEMRPRAGEEVRVSEMNSYMLHEWEKLSQSPLMTNDIAKSTPKSFAEPPAVVNGGDNSTVISNGGHN